MLAALVIISLLRPLWVRAKATFAVRLSLLDAVTP